MKKPTSVLVVMMLSVLVVIGGSSCSDKLKSIAGGLPAATGPHLDVGLGWDESPGGAIPWLSSPGMHSFGSSWVIEDVRFLDRDVSGNIIDLSSRPGSIEFFYRDSDGGNRTTLREYIRTFPLTTEPYSLGGNKYVFDTDNFAFSENALIADSSINDDGCRATITVPPECGMVVIMTTVGGGTKTVFIRFPPALN